MSGEKEKATVTRINSQKGARPTEPPDVSLVMIVKNEEDFLDACLSSAKGFYKELIVVDTGSTDSTKKIARDHGAKLYDFEWIHDFSAARNFALTKATRQWILQLDADEKLASGQLDRFVQLLSDAEKEVYFLYINDVGRDDIFPQIRLFKNNGHIKYSGEVHNQIIDVRYGALKGPGFADIVIEHYGYTEDVRQKKNKFDRNIALLKAKLEKDPSTFYLYCLANEYYANKELDIALQYFEQIAKIMDILPADVVRDYADTLGKMKMFDRAIELIKKHLFHYPDHPDLYFLAGLASLSTQRLKDAEGYFEKALTLDAFGKYRVWKGSNSYRSLHGLAMCKIKAGNESAAADIMLKALKLNDKDIFAINFLLPIIFARGGKKGLEADLYPLIDISDPKVQKMIHEFKHD